MKKQLILLLFIVSTCTFAQETPERLIQLNEVFIKYADKEQYDSVGIYIEKFKKNKNLTPYEIQVTTFLEATYYYRINKFEKAIDLFEKAKKLNTNLPKTIKFYNLANASIADVYFTKQNYKKAFEYAKMCEGKLADGIYIEKVNIHSIIGYYYYLNNNLELSLKNYKIVEQVILTNEAENKLPEIYPKIARIYAKQNNLKVANQYINKAIFLAKKYKYIIDEINVRKARFDILKDAKLFQKALQENDTINILNEQNNLNNRNIKFDEVETKYKTKLKEQENSSLKTINKEKEQKINQQNLLILVSGLGFLLVSVLAFLIYKSSKKRAEINKKLSEQNTIIEQNNNDLERLNLLNKKIFSVISHDFKEPMLSMELLLKMDEKSNMDAELFNKNKEKIRDKVIQANLVMDNLLNWAKTELGIIAVTESLTNIFTESEIVKLQLESLIKNKKIEVINEIPVENTLLISADILKIIYRNLISNAIKYSFEDNNIILGFNAKTNEYFVQDFGIGIEKSRLKNLFSTHVVSKIGTNYETGFGIGLHFVSELIEKHNGKIRVESILNEGTIVFFKF